VLPWAAREASAWREACKKQLRCFPGDVKAPEAQKVSVDAFGLIQNKGVRQKLFSPEFKAEPHGWWQQNVFAAWDDIFQADRAEVNLP
jgi:hypothetical protein